MFSASVTLILKEHAVKKSQYTEEQIASAMKQAETGTPVAEVIGRVVWKSGRL